MSLKKSQANKHFKLFIFIVYYIVREQFSKVVQLLPCAKSLFFNAIKTIIPFLRVRNKIEIVRIWPDNIYGFFLESHGLDRPTDLGGKSQQVSENLENSRRGQESTRER